MPGEPCARECGGLLESARFREWVARAGHDPQRVLAPEHVISVHVRYERDIVVASDDEQGGGADQGETVCGLWVPEMRSGAREFRRSSFWRV